MPEPDFVSILITTLGSLAITLDISDSEMNPSAKKF